MKKVGLLTFHRSCSYGASLQAYATVEFIKEHGYDIEIVDYTNPYEQRFEKKIYSENGKLSGYFSVFIKNVFFKKSHYARLAFGNMTQYYPVSKDRYRSKDALKNVEYDILVAGSDQIWNRNITDGLDEVMLLQFGKAEKRISLASSMGSIILNNNEKETFRRSFRSFSSISVREEHGRKQLQPLTDKTIKLLMDPTFLFSREEWIQKLGGKSKYYKKTESYILTYFVAPNRTYRTRTEEFAKKFGLPVWSIQPTTFKRIKCKKSILGARIEDLIALIANADLVLTDSFHGVAMSLNLHSDFVAFKNEGNPIRVISLLEKLEIPERVNMKPSLYNSVDYKKVDNVLEPLRADSQKWVIEALES